MPITNAEDPNWTDIWRLLLAGLGLELVILFFPVFYAVYSTVRVYTRGGESVDSQNFKDNNAAYQDVRSLFTVESALDNLDTHKISMAMNRKNSVGARGSRIEQFYVRWSVRRLLVDDFVLSVFGPYIEYVRLLLNVIGIVLFSISSFQMKISFSIAVMNVVVGAFMLIDFLFKAFFMPFPSEGNVFAYLLGPSVVVEAISAPSILFAGIGLVSYANFGFFRVVPLYSNVVKICYPAENKIESEEGLSIKRIRPFIICWSAYIASLFFSLACFVLLAELLPASDFWKSDEWSVGNAVYFMIVTVTTVGYGDFSPITYPGVLATMLFLVFVLFYVALKVSFLIDVYSNTKAGKGAYARRPGARFVVILGSPSFNELSAFLSAFYSSPVLLSTDVVVLSLQKICTSDELGRIRRQSKYGSRVKFFLGTVLSEVDRRRISFRDAEAVFTFASGYEQDSLSQDARNILRVVCLRDRWASLPLYASHVLPETFVHMERSIKLASGSDRLGDALCQRDLWASFAAMNVRCPGSSTLVTNLFASWDTSLAEEDLPWLREYKLGASNYLEGLIVADEATSRTSIGELTRELYLDGGLLLLAVTDAASKTMFFPNLHPNEPVTAGSVAFLIGNETKIRAMRNSPLFLPAALVSSSRYSSVNRTALRTAIVTEPSKSKKKITQTVGEVSSSVKSSVPDHKLDRHMIISGYSALSLPDAGLLATKLSNQLYNERNQNKASDIVILLPNLESNEIRKFREKHPYVRIRGGSALVLDDLVSVGLQTAKSLVVLLEVGEGNRPQTLEYDSRPVFTMMLVDQVVSSCRDDLTIQTFIRDTSAVGLLRAPQPRFLNSMLGAPQNRATQTVPVSMDSNMSQCFRATHKNHAVVVDGRKLMAEEMFNRPRYAAGEVVITSVMGSCMSKDYQVPGALRLLKFLVDADCSESHSNSCHLHLIGVPPSLAGKAYWRVFEVLFEKGALPMGLYRSGRGSMWVPPVSTEDRRSLWAVRTRDGGEFIPSDSADSLSATERSEVPAGSTGVSGGVNSLPWVYTNPESHTVVPESDGIFILATNQVFNETLDELFGDVETISDKPQGKNVHEIVTKAPNSSAVRFLETVCDPSD